MGLAALLPHSSTRQAELLTFQAAKHLEYVSQRGQVQSLSRKGYYAERSDMCYGAHACKRQPLWTIFLLLLFKLESRRPKMFGDL